jgi:small ligand-binding sensory domain FIST
MTEFCAAAHWPGGFDEAGLAEWAAKLRQRIPAPAIDLGLVFISPGLAPHAKNILEVLRVYAKIPTLAGCSGSSLIVNEQELEETRGLVLGLYHLPGIRLTADRFTQADVEESTGPAYWHEKNGVTPEQINGWLAFADPFHLDAEHWLQQWNAAYPELPIVGGLATGAANSHATQVYLNEEVFDDGGIALGIGGDVSLCSMISQGCTPIGETWTITKTDRNIIYEIGNRPAYEVLAETFAGLPPSEQKQARGNLFVGLVVNEYLEEFHRGDFLIRGLMGADPNSGAIQVGALPRTGQTIQFQHRVASAGTEDLVTLLDQAADELGGRAIFGACLCSCNGRGSQLFGTASHDSGHVQRRLGPLGLVGFFCNGEIGPIGRRNFLHGYTASLALFVGKH